MAVVTGDREINELKLKKALNAAELELAADSVVEQVTGAPVGFAGPVKGPSIPTVFDISVRDIRNGITGANRRDVHYSGVNPGRDFTIREEHDITSARKGDACPVCGAEMYEKKGIEVGHIFKLGYKYSKAMNVSVLDESGKTVTPIMGCYGIGVTRTLAAIVEQHNDERGIIWPVSVAPFPVHLVGLGKSEEELGKVEEIYRLLLDRGFDVLYDDRKASPGFKFADADLLGMPVRVTVGKSYFQDGDIEVKLRSSADISKVKAQGLAEEITRLLEK
jgi:prolyl-tRNA synthetase